MKAHFRGNSSKISVSYRLFKDLAGGSTRILMTLIRMKRECESMYEMSWHRNN